MGNLAKGIKEPLPEFQKFLLERSLAPEKNVPFLAYWVSRFLTFGRKRDISTADYHEGAVIEFLDMLRADEKILDWQPRQADDALKLYSWPRSTKDSMLLCIRSATALPPICFRRA